MVALALLREQLDLVVSEGFSNLNNPITQLKEDKSCVDVLLLMSQVGMAGTAMGVGHSCGSDNPF